MDIKFGKRLNSFTLKTDLDKSKSIVESKKASLAVQPGTRIDMCPLCDSTRRRFSQAIYNFEYHECLDCGVAYVINPPTDAEIMKMYSSAYYTNIHQTLYCNDNIVDYRISNIAVPKVEYILDHLTNGRNSWIDIGCGTGEILSVVTKKGFEALGVETNEVARTYGSRKYGVRIVDEYINQHNIQNYANKYGVVSLFSVLEHTRNPRTLIENISRMQIKNDNLVIEVPHFPSISAYSQITFPDHVNRIMLPPLHLFLFSLKSLTSLLEKNSYEITNVWMFGQDFYEFFSTLTLFVPGLDHSVLQEKILLMINDFQEVIDKHELSDEILIIAKKLA